MSKLESKNMVCEVESLITKLNDIMNCQLITENEKLEMKNNVVKIICG